MPGVRPAWPHRVRRHGVASAREGAPSCGACSKGNRFRRHHQRLSALNNALSLGAVSRKGGSDHAANQTKRKSKKQDTARERSGALTPILSADFSRLAEELAAVEAAGADGFIVDVMDGTAQSHDRSAVVEALRPLTKLP